MPCCADFILKRGPLIGLIGQSLERVSLDEPGQIRRISAYRPLGIVYNFPKAENLSASVEAKGFLHG